MVAGLLIALAEVCSVQWSDDGTCTVMPGPGTGLVDGKGWVHCPRVGPYTIHGGSILGKSGVVMCGLDVAANRGAFSPIQQTSSLLEWTRPDGVREPIPRELLYP
jgi:hypothetical protein